MKKEKYYVVEIITDGFKLSTSRIDDLEIAKQLINDLGDSIKVSNVIKEDKITKPKLPYHLKSLQRECNKYFGYSAEQTLEYAQNLYEKNLITNPMTDIRYLSMLMIVPTINTFLGKNDFDTDRIKVVFNSMKLKRDNHAIIPNIELLKKKDISRIPSDEYKVYSIIYNKFHASVGYPMVETTIKIETEFNGFKFKGSNKFISDEGFMKFMNEFDLKNNKKVVLPNVKDNDILGIVEKKIKVRFSKLS